MKYEATGEFVPLPDPEPVSMSITMTNVEGTNWVTYPISDGMYVLPSSSSKPPDTEEGKQQLRDLVAWYNRERGTHYEVVFSDDVATRTEDA